MVGDRDHEIISMCFSALSSGYVKIAIIAIENGHRNSGFSHWKWWFSIAMLVYQRVSSSVCRTARFLCRQVVGHTLLDFWVKQCAFGWNDPQTQSTPNTPANKSPNNPRKHINKKCHSSILSYPQLTAPHFSWKPHLISPELLDTGLAMAGMEHMDGEVPPANE